MVCSFGRSFDHVFVPSCDLMLLCSGVRSFVRSVFPWVGRSVVRVYAHSCGRVCVRVSVNVFVQVVASVNGWFVRSVVCSFGRSVGPVLIPSCNLMSLCSVERSFVRSVGRSLVYTFILAVMLAFVCLLMCSFNSFLPSMRGSCGR